MVGQSMFNAILFIFFFWLGKKIPSKFAKGERLPHEYSSHKKNLG